jgi:hypothetical protein
MPLSLVLAGAIAVAATSARAAPLASCKPGNAIYRATTDYRYEIEFFKDLQAESENAGVLRYRGRTRVYKYQLSTGWSLGFSRLHASIEGDKKPDLNSRFGSGWALTSVMLEFGPNFRLHRNNKTAPPYLVIPRLGQEFYDWHEEQARHPKEKIIPPEAWKLVRCRG